MPISEQQLAEAVRQEIGFPDASQNIRITWLIPRALELLTSRISNNAKKKHYLLTEITPTLDVNGKTDLTAFLDNPRILLDRLTEGYVYHADSPLPMQYLANPTLNGLEQCDGDDFLFYSLEGKILSTKNFTKAQPTNLTGQITMRVPFLPTLADIPVELESDLIGIMVQLAIIPQDNEEEDGQMATAS